MKNLKHLFIIVAIACVLNSSAISPNVYGQTLNQTVKDATFVGQIAQASETDKLLQEAYVLLTQGKFDEALANCIKATELNPTDDRPLVMTGLVYAAQLKLKLASESFDKAIPLAPRLRVKQIYILKADVDGRRGATDEGIAAARKALELDPNSAEAYGLMGEALKGDEKRRAEAIAAYRAAIKLKPDLWPAYLSLAQLFEQAKDEKSAEAVYRQAISVDPKHARVRSSLGRILVKQKRLAEARKLWEGRTSDEDNTFPQFIELLKRAENLQRATEALAQKPKDPDALVEMGMAVMEGDHWVVDSRQKRAIVYFQEALKLKPDHARAQSGIVKAYIQIASTFADEKKHVDDEMAKLRKLDPALADEMEAYRKSYVGGIVVGAPFKP